MRGGKKEGGREGGKEREKEGGREDWNSRKQATVSQCL